jgi:hypothetical protein
MALELDLQDAVFEEFGRRGASDLVQLSAVRACGTV